MLGDPANFIDPDGRAGIPFLQDFMKSDGGTFLLNLAGQATFLGAMLSPLGSIGGTLSNIVSIGASLYSIGSSVATISSISIKGQQRLTFCANALSQQNKKAYTNLSSDIKTYQTVAEIYPTMTNFVMCIWEIENFIVVNDFYCMASSIDLIASLDDIPVNKGRRYANPQRVGNDPNQTAYSYQRVRNSKLNEQAVKRFSDFERAVRNSLGPSNYEEWFGNSKSSQSEAIRAFYQLIKLGLQIREVTSRNCNSAMIQLSSTTEISIFATTTIEQIAELHNILSLERQYQLSLENAFNKYFYGGFSVELMNSYSPEKQEEFRQKAWCSALNEVGWLSPIDIIKKIVSSLHGSNVLQTVHDTGFMLQPSIGPGR
jgi:hypothetical protein